MRKIDSQNTLLCPAGESLPSGHPDAKLLDLWNRYVSAVRDYNAMSGSLPDDEGAWDRIEDIGNRIRITMALTPAGTSVRLKFGLVETTAIPATCFGGPMPAELRGNRGLSHLWRLIEHLDRQGGTSDHAPQGFPYPDAFEVAVTKFEAPVAALPASLTDVLAEAGAEAAGCSPEAFRRGFEAMLAKHKEAA